MPSTHNRAVTTIQEAVAEKGVLSSDAGAVRVSMTRDNVSFNNQKAADYVNKHRYVNLKNEQKIYKFDPYLPFQNVKLGRDYYIVPTENPKRGADLSHTQPIALTIEKIGNPSTAKRQPIKPVAVPITNAWTDKEKNPADKNTNKRMTERQQLVLYPNTIRSRYSR